MTANIDLFWFFFTADNTMHTGCCNTNLLTCQKSISAFFLSCFRTEASGCGGWIKQARWSAWLKDWVMPMEWVHFPAQGNGGIILLTCAWCPEWRNHCLCKLRPLPLRCLRPVRVNLVNCNVIKLEERSLAYPVAAPRPALVFAIFLFVHLVQVCLEQWFSTRGAYGPVST